MANDSIYGLSGWIFGKDTRQAVSVASRIRTGTVNNNNQACYKLDKANNRTNVKVDVGSLPACP